MAGKANQRFQEALAFAAEAHAAVNQERKGTDFPYMAHPIRVAEILNRFGYSEEVVVAGFLHDTIEDANITPDEIDRRRRGLCSMPSDRSSTGTTARSRRFCSERRQRADSSGRSISRHRRSSPMVGIRRVISRERLSEHLTTRGRTSPTRSGTGGRTTPRSNWRPVGSAQATFPRALRRYWHRAAPTRDAGLSRAS